MSNNIISIKNDYGIITISKELVATITGIVTAECYGVVGVAPSSFRNDLTGILKRDSLARGVNVEWLDEKLFLQIFIVVGYGVRISEVAHNVIRRVEYSVKEITGLPVGKVNIFIRGVKVINK